MYRKYFMLFMLPLMAIPCVAQGTGTTAGCNISGTWYGGSPDAPSPYYQGVITSIGANRFSALFQFVPEIQSLGYLHGTNWTGEFSKTDPHSYSGMLFSMYHIDGTKMAAFPPGVDPTLPELDVIQINNVEILDCDTIKFTYGILVVYYNLTYDIKPLETVPVEPSFTLTFDPPMVEVYHRMSTSVPESFVSATVSSAAARPNSGRPLRRRK